MLPHAVATNHVYLPTFKLKLNKINLDLPHFPRSTIMSEIQTVPADVLTQVSTASAHHPHSPPDLIQGHQQAQFKDISQSCRKYV